MNTEKKYKLLREVLNATTGHIIPVGEIFKQYKDTQKYYSSNGWLMSEDSCLKKDWFKEVIEDKELWLTTNKLDAMMKNVWEAAMATHTILGTKEFKTFEEYKATLPENQTEAPLPQKDYEILTYINPNAFTDIVGGNIMKPCSIATLRDYPIHSIKRLSDNTIWTVGEETQHGVIKNIEKEDDEHPIVFYVGKTNYPLFISELKKL